MTNLVDALRENGFLVSVYNSNPGFLIGEEEGEIAIAYGHNKKIGFSSHNNSFRGYSNGDDNILFDYFGEFNKWSQCLEIEKKNKIDKIVKLLKETKNENNIEG